MASSQTDPNLSFFDGLNASVEAESLTPTSNTDTNDLVFPLDLLNYRVWMTMAFSEYKVPSFYTNNANGSVLQPTGTTIRLPLPNYMVDTQIVNYDQEALGLALGLGLNQFAAVGSEFQGQSGDIAAAIAAGAAATIQGGLASDILSGAKHISSLLGIPGDQAQSALENALGYTINPFLTVMFKTPAFKKHVLSWKLSPKNATESKKIASIINVLRFNQLSDIAPGGAGLAYPSVLHVSVKNAPTPYFNYVFKPAVIEACAVNYTPAGQPSFYNDTLAPGEVEISLSILEIELWLRKNYAP